MALIAVFIWWVDVERTNKLGESQGAARDPCKAAGIGRV